MRGSVNKHQRHQTVLVLVGPTASGKTPISLDIAKRLDAEIISADSRQVYKALDIGTAKPTLEERAGVRHFFVDEIPPDEAFNAGDFGARGRDIIDDMFRRGKTPLVVGGSGLYIQGLIDGFFEGPSGDDVLREELEERIRMDGAIALLEELRMFDPSSAARMLPSHTRRIIRAHEVYRLTGIPLSQLQGSRLKVDFAPVFAGLQWERSKLYHRINERVDRMMAQGFLNEVRNLRERGFSRHLRALNTVGYKEMNDHLDGTISLERAIELMKQNSRRYAKRQLTWFRYNSRIRWFDLHSELDFPDVASDIVQYFLRTKVSKR